MKCIDLLFGADYKTQLFGNLTELMLSSLEKLVRIFHLFQAFLENFENKICSLVFLFKRVKKFGG